MTSFILGVTGGLACGKSEVGRVLEKMNYTVCDTDHVAHGLMKKGQAVYDRVVEHFGNSILEDGEISRPVLGKIIFESPKERDSLNQLVHPAVEVYLKNWIHTARKHHKKAAALIPLLFESGMERLDWDAVLCVTSEHEQIMERLAKRGFSRQEALLRMKAQLTTDKKAVRSDAVIENTGTLSELEQFTREAVRKVRVEKR